LEVILNEKFVEAFIFLKPLVDAERIETARQEVNIKHQSINTVRQQ
jgi:hypothetical protein